MPGHWLRRRRRTATGRQSRARRSQADRGGLDFERLYARCIRLASFFVTSLERGENTSMDCGVPARGYHSKATGSRYVFALDATDLERHPIRESVAT